jgi:hypothetical protein
VNVALTEWNRLYFENKLQCKTGGWTDEEVSLRVKLLFVLIFVTLILDCNAQLSAWKEAELGCDLRRT